LSTRILSLRQVVSDP